MIKKYIIFAVILFIIPLILASSNTQSHPTDQINKTTGTYWGNWSLTTILDNINSMFSNYLSINGSNANQDINISPYNLYTNIGIFQGINISDGGSVYGNAMFYGNLYFDNFFSGPCGDGQAIQSIDEWGSFSCVAVGGGGVGIPHWLNTSDYLYINSSYPQNIKIGGLNVTESYARFSGNMENERGSLGYPNIEIGEDTYPTIIFDDGFDTWMIDFLTGSGLRFYQAGNVHMIVNTQGILTDENVTADWFKGKFNWTSADDWNIFDGSTLDFNKSKLSTIYYNLTQVELIAGTIDGGTLADTQHQDGAYDSVTLNISESAGAPGLDIRLNFTGIEDFNRGVMRYKTGNLAGDFPIIMMWNYDESEWEDYPVVAESESFATITQPVFDSSDHLQDGVAQMRIYKAGNGNINNHYYIDWIAISKGYGTPSGQEVDPHFKVWLNNAVFEYNVNGSMINITAKYFLGDGSKLTGISTYNSTYAGFVDTNDTSTIESNNASWVTTYNSTYAGFNGADSWMGNYTFYYNKSQVDNKVNTTNLFVDHIAEKTPGHNVVFDNDVDLGAHNIYANSFWSDTWQSLSYPARVRLYQYSEGQYAFGPFGQNMDLGSGELLEDPFRDLYLSRDANIGGNANIGGDITGEKLAIETNALFVNDGHTGIGTTTPSKRLSVVSTGVPANDEVRFFYDPSEYGGNPDVGDAVDGPSLYGWRRAAEADDYWRLYTDKNRYTILDASYVLQFYRAGTKKFTIGSSTTSSFNQFSIPSDSQGISFGAGGDWDIYSDGTDFIIDRNLGAGIVKLPDGSIRMGTGNNYIQTRWATDAYIESGAGSIYIRPVVGKDVGIQPVAGNVLMSLPASDPGVATALWNDGGVVKISAG